MHTQGANVDEEIEPVVDAVRGNSRVNDHALTFALHDVHSFQGHLFCNQRGDIGLEASCADAHHNDANDEACQGTMLAIQDARSSRGDHNNVSYDGDHDRVHDGPVAAEISVGNVCTWKEVSIQSRLLKRVSSSATLAEERDDVDPELVECGDAGSSLGPHAESSSDGIWERRIPNGRISSGSVFLILDEVGDYECVLAPRAYSRGSC